MKKTVSLTQDGKKNLENELKSLIKMRPAIADRLATARSFGDLKENQEYSDARGRSYFGDSRYLKKCRNY